MKLRNKKTGEIFVEVDAVRLTLHRRGLPTLGVQYSSFTELKEEWEDYKLKEPLIRDEKIRKIFRLLFDVWGVEHVKIDSNKYFLVTTIESLGKAWKLEIPSININGVFKLTELCGEEEE